ncbi:5-bromo-4-chloroindolyl phosphate hydrolysis family protein [Paracoccus sp. Z330]|uniref:5-bromo-4-chloroindolyl phosphate hydrolysis family protein n=1 Tax=Paracoccus onchidii TaxID=3017813 RepID=A0ABT4ZD12_9RHOB|nr:5-bromo-4-chloroindolyl phosphate hydrolysis family protein [Paracoccus onchidii]MDB6176858.1 5-bromo-4-chloroindolyl phosphate hydrolysis family protein [Paracoccus onchidii]
MAQRFGGRYSPDPGSDNDPQRRKAAGPTLHRLSSRPKWVTIAALPFLFAAFFQPPIGMVANLCAFGLIAAGMWLTREGLAAEAAYDLRATSRAPAIPRKLFGGILAGLGLGLGAAEPGAIGGAALIGIVGFALHFLAFGADPMRAKGMEHADDFQADRAARMIEEGEAHLSQMQNAIRRTGDRRLEARVMGFAATVQDLFDQVREDPGDLSAARRYMGVYLQGARDATEKFASLYARSRDEKSRLAYEEFLNDLENDFKARSDKLLDGDRDDLAIEISVLRERLQREGVRPAKDAVDSRRLTSEQARTLDDLLTPADKAGKDEIR